MFRLVWGSFKKCLAAITQFYAVAVERISTKHNYTFCLFLLPFSFIFILYIYIYFFFLQIKIKTEKKGVCLVWGYRTAFTLTRPPIPLVKKLDLSAMKERDLKFNKLIKFFSMVNCSNQTMQFCDFFISLLLVPTWSSFCQETQIHSEIRVEVKKPFVFTTSTHCFTFESHSR